MKIAFLIFAFVILWGTSAEAAQIQNLSDKSQTIEILDQHNLKVILKPNEIWYTHGRAEVKWRTREVSIAYDEEYVIWNDDTFGIQRRLGNNTNRNPN